MTCPIVDWFSDVYQKPRITVNPWLFSLLWGKYGLKSQ